MGIDICHKYERKARRVVPKSQDPYQRLLAKVYKNLAVKTGSKFNAIIAKRLCMSRINRAPISVSKITKFVKREGNEGKIVVTCSPVVNDPRIVEIPKMRIVTTKITRAARARVIKAGGEVLTFDQLAVIAPTGKNTLLVQGSRNNREAVKHFGAPGVPGSKSKPFTTSKGRKFERARGRRKTCGFKV
ncbi:60S ribosomal protein L18 [Strongyloides ratti]|uniref:Large ribosomal subunit protein eL18 n=1 Tax=Strongyloides ratti TaxID=34506 RepID=A0A090L5U3_STRRB|nr:60S ribosomal protein L18 [Strongyloides ratti]CEF65151.1 60S ribosomal protein L18 [Strongyloides ratti]